MRDSLRLGYKKTDKVVVNRTSSRFFQTCLVVIILSVVVYYMSIYSIDIVSTFESMANKRASQVDDIIKNVK